MVISKTAISVIVALAVVVGAFGLGFKLGHKYKTADVVVEQNDAIIELNNRIDQEAGKLNSISEELSKMDFGVRTITKVVTRNVYKEIEKPVYRECVVPDSGVQLITDFAAELNKARKSENPR